MAYVLALQPSAIAGFGPDAGITDINGVFISKSALLVMCALISGLVTILMGLYANLPLALSCGMGTNFMLGGMVQAGVVSFGWVMALLLCSGIIFILITVCGVRKVVVKMLPKNMKIALLRQLVSSFPTWVLTMQVWLCSKAAPWLWVTSLRLPLSWR